MEHDTFSYLIRNKLNFGALSSTILIGLQYILCFLEGLNLIFVPLHNFETLPYLDKLKVRDTRSPEALL